MRDIEIFDKYFTRPEKVKVGNITGRIIYSETSAGLFDKCTAEERLATFEEVMCARVKAFDELNKDLPGLERLVNSICDGQNPNNRYDILRNVLERLQSDNPTYSVWKTRLTTSTHMARTKDKVFFYTGNPFDDERELIQSMTGELSDGGIKYSEQALMKIIKETPEDSTMSYEEYIKSKGGNFTGKDWLEHPIFSRACRDKGLLQKYVFAMQVLNLTDFYNQGWHSGWRPGEMKEGYGRPVSLGYKGEAFYPPNNSTLDHAALVLSK